MLSHFIETTPIKNKLMGRKTRPKCKAIVVTFQDQIINIELNQDECIQEKNELEKLPKIRKRKRKTNKKIQIDNNNQLKDKNTETQVHSQINSTESVFDFSVFNDFDSNEEELDEFIYWFK